MDITRINTDGIIDGVKPINPELIASVLGTTLYELSLSARQSGIVTRRHLFCWLTRKYSGLSLNEIGKLINRDHATVLHSINTINNYIDIKYPNIIERIKTAQEAIDELSANPGVVANECLRMAKELERLASVIINTLNDAESIPYRTIG